MLCATTTVSAQNPWYLEGNITTYPTKDHFLGTLNSTPVRFKTNSIERMRLTETGLFGIGTETPTQLLDVDGQIRLRFGAVNYKVLSSDANGNATWAFLQLDLSGNNLSVLNHGNAIDLSAYLDNTDTQTLSLTGTTLSISNANNVLFTGWDTDASNDFSGDYNDLTNLPILFDGNYNSLTNLPTLFNGDYNSLSNLPILFDGNWSSLVGTPTVEEINYWSKLDDNLFYNTANVGIGIDVPQKLLHIHSDNTFIPGGGLSPGHVHSDITFISAGGLSPERIPTKKAGPFNNIRPVSSSSSMLFTNVNSGSTASDGLIIRSYDNNATIYLQETGSLTLCTKNNLRLKMQQNGNVSIGELNTNFFTVKENGRVGIGTDEPEQAIDVVGSGKISDDLFVGGRIGVGTENPQNALDVAGTIRSKEWIVEQTGWNDFVFDENYILPPLKEREAQILKNKHLPYILPEKQILEDGAPMGSTITGLLQNTEELYLYLFQLNEKIQNLENENKDLKQLIENLNQ